MSSLEKNKTFSLFVERALPKFVQEDHPQFVEFTKKYFEFLEQDYNSLDLILHYLTYNNIDTIMDDLRCYYYQTYTATLPQTFCDSFSFFIKHVREFYRMKGNEKSFEYLFREFFNSEVEFFYPSTKVFYLSASNWYEPYYIVPETQDLDLINKFKNHPVRGQTTLAKAIVTETRFIEDNQSPPEFNYSIIVNNREGFFIEGETIKSLIDPNLTLNIRENDGIIEEEGQIADKEGILSGNFYLQDNYYYQDFSYEIQSTVSISDYKDLIEKTVHPAGFIFFSALKPYLNSLLVEFDLHKLSSNLIDITSNYHLNNESEYEDNYLKVHKQIYSFKNLISFYENFLIENYEGEIIYPYLHNDMILNENYENPHENSFLDYKVKREFINNENVSELNSSLTNIKYKTYPNELIIYHYDNYLIDEYETEYTRRYIENYNIVAKEDNKLKIEKSLKTNEIHIDKFNFTENNDLLLNSAFEKHYTADDFAHIPIETFENVKDRPFYYGHSSLIEII